MTRLPCFHGTGLLVRVLALLFSTRVASIELNTEESLSDAVKRNPRDSSARMKKVQWHLRWGELRKAITELQSAVKADPVHAWEYREVLGDLYFNYARDVRSAEEQYREALALNPVSRRSLLQAGSLRIWQGRRSEADPLFHRALKEKLLADVRQRPLELSRPPGTISSAPWHNVNESKGSLSAAVARLSAAMDDISAEYLKWAKTRAKDSEVDQEWLADPSGPGRWRHFWIYRPGFDRGVWRSVCSHKTPKTCKILASLNNTGSPGEKFVVLRADFDVLEPRAKIRPHCHATDTETFFMLPILVPRLGPNSTTSLVVGGERRSWKEGEATLFDATFEHEESIPALPSAPGPDASGHDYALELRQFYDSKGLVDKVSGIPEILVKWQGKEEKMMRELRKKYLEGWKGERVALRLLLRSSVLKQTQAKNSVRSEL